MAVMCPESVAIRKKLRRSAQNTPHDINALNTIFETVPAELQATQANYFLSRVLEVALETQNLPMLDWVLSKGVTKSYILNPASHLAVLTQKVDLLNNLIQAGVSVEGLGLGSSDFPDGENGLLTAIQTQQIDMLQCLIQAGAELNFATKQDRSPLEMAESLGNTEIVNALKSAGATGLSEEHLTLKEAVKRRKWLRASVFLPEGEERKVHQILEPLFEAPDTEALQALLPALSEKQLVFSLGKAAQAGHLDWVLTYLEAGADINGLPGLPNKYWPDGWGDTALVLASERNQIEMVAYLLKQGADPNFTDKRKDTALHAAAKRNYVDVAKLLLAAGADYKVKNDQKETPMKKAKDYWGRDVIPLLKKAGAKPRTATGIARSTKKKLKPYEKIAFQPKVKSGLPEPTGSHYGGDPCLNGDWPLCGQCKEPLSFFIQLNLAELPMPQHTGLAQLFYCTHCKPYDAKSKGWLASVISGDQCKRLATPKDTPRFSPVCITGWKKPKADYPWREHEIWETQALDAEEQEKAVDYNLTGDKVGGWPHWLQDPEYPKDSDGEPMTFLMQLDHGHLPYVWGDSGAAYLFLSKLGNELAFAWQCL